MRKGHGYVHAVRRALLRSQDRKVQRCPALAPEIVRDCFGTDMRFLALLPIVSLEIGPICLFSTNQRCKKIDDGIVCIMILGSASDFHVLKHCPCFYSDILDSPSALAKSPMSPAFTGHLDG